MASAKENVPVAPQPLPRQTSNSNSPRPPPPPLRPKMANAATEPPPVSGVLKCTCFRLPIRAKKPLPPPPAPKLHSASGRRSAVAPDLSAAPVTASQSQRVTFRASASLSTWWPSSPPTASAGAGAGAGATPAAPAGSGEESIGIIVAPRRASASSAVAPTMKAGAASTSSSSFSHWRCRRSLSSRVIPHGERASFSFAVSPSSTSSSCMSTPKIPQGWQQK